MGAHMDEVLAELEEGLLGRMGGAIRNIFHSGHRLTPNEKAAFERLHPREPKGRGRTGGQFATKGGKVVKAGRPPEFDPAYLEKRRKIMAKYGGPRRTITAAEYQEELTAEQVELVENVLSMLGRRGKHVMSAMDRARFEKLHPRAPKTRKGAGEWIDKPADFKGSRAEYAKTLGGQWSPARMASALADDAGGAPWMQGGKASPRLWGPIFDPHRSLGRGLLQGEGEEPHRSLGRGVLQAKGARSLGRGLLQKPGPRPFGSVKRSYRQGPSVTPSLGKDSPPLKSLGAKGDTSGVTFLGGWKPGLGGPVVMRYSDYLSRTEGRGTLHQLTNAKGEIVAWVLGIRSVRWRRSTRRWRRRRRREARALVVKRHRGLDSSVFK